MRKLPGILSLILILPALSADAENVAELHTVIREPGEAWRPAASDPVRAAPFAASDREIVEGWPVYLSTPSSGFPYTPTLKDVDGDGADEIFLTGGHTFGLYGDGSFMPGWPTSEMSYMGYGTNGCKPGPSVWDLENDGDQEILWTTRDWWAGNSYLWCFNGKDPDGSDLPGYPQYAVDDYSNALDTPFVLGDTDGDGKLEAWGPHTLGNAFVYYRISAFDHQGTRRFTVDLDPDESILSLYFGDLDGNGDEEMFAVSFKDPSLYLHVFESDGGPAPGYPILFHSFAGGYLPFGPPVPADLDEDGDLEILYGHNSSGASSVYCRHHDGGVYAGFPLALATSSQLFYIGLGDITGDGDPELLAFDNHLGGDYRVHARDLASGMILPGWPVPLPHWPKGFPTVVDVDDDGLQEVCAATDGGELYAIDSEGQVLAGYPKAMVSSSISGVGAGDIDGDGLFELVAATWDGWVYAWNTTGQVLPGRADWPLRNLNPRNTGVYERAVLTAAGPGQPEWARATLRVFPNPIRHRGEFILSGAPAGGRLDIYDLMGRLVDRVSLVDEQTLIWRPDPSLPAGVYLARLKEAPEVVGTKIVLLR